MVTNYDISHKKSSNIVAHDKSEWINEIVYIGKN